MTANDLLIQPLKRPAHVILELTYRCPARCPGCPSTLMEHRQDELDGEAWERVIYELSSITDELRLSGGEPARHPHFSRIVDSLERAKMPYIIFTSGLWENLEEVISLLKRSRMLRGLDFSIHGSVEHIHDTFMGGRSFGKTIAAIEKCAKEGIPFQTSSVLFETGKRHMKDFIRFIFSTGSRAHVFRRYLGPIRQEISIGREDLSLLLNYVRTISRKGLPVHIDGCFPACFFENSYACLAGITYCAIDPCGNVKPCPFSLVSFGNVKDTPVKKIWKSRRLRAWVRNYPDACGGCAALRLCRGGCRVAMDYFRIKKDPLFESPLACIESIKR